MKIKNCNLNKRKHPLSAAVLALLILTVSACAGTGAKQQPADFTNDGFLNDDNFQVIVRGRPDKTAKGLVEQRESARTNASFYLEKAALSRLAQYICGADKTILFDNTVQLLNDYLKYGSIYEEYYLPDNSIILVYRFSKSGLRKDITSIRCGGKEAAAAQAK